MVTVNGDTASGARANRHDDHPRPVRAPQRRLGPLPSRRTPPVAGQRLRSATTGGAVPPPPLRDRNQGLTKDAVSWLSVLAPTTLLTGLLFYFGYVGTRARYEYFGVDLTMVELSSQQLLLAGLEVVYGAALVLCVVVLLVAGVHGLVSWLLVSGARQLAGWLAGLSAVVGLLLVGRGLVGIAVPAVAGAESPPGQTRLALALGPVFIAYGLWVATRLAMGRVAELPDSSRIASWCRTPTARLLRRTGVAAVLSIFIIGMFSATNSFAWAFGTGRAYQNALHLEERPEVVLELRERLSMLPRGVVETRLDPGSGAGFRYRYRGLRLLVAAGGKLFLIPAPWTRAGRTIIVPYDNDVRIQLIPAGKIYDSR